VSGILPDNKAWIPAFAPRGAVGARNDNIIKKVVSGIYLTKSLDSRLRGNDIFCG
jgi:hypothetical protein